mmetsp:Transcript_14818/g.33716  ORF Transcript_14818/g.33716 Transcript_14818/m.33716 type:complete len:92 (-) Transcript_14818:78-353(-)
MPFLFWYCLRKHFRQLWDEQEDQRGWSSQPSLQRGPEATEEENQALRSENERLKRENESLRASITSLPLQPVAAALEESATTSQPEVAPDA